MNSRFPNNNDDQSFLRLLYLYVWPFWLFADASSGNDAQQAAAYQHNSGMCIHLPGYATRWIFICALLLTAAEQFGARASQIQVLDSFLMMSVAASMAFIGAVCVLVLTASSYVYLNYVKA